MTKHTYAIVGATGQIGLCLTEELLKKGHKVRALGRDPVKLQRLKEKGAEVFSSPFNDAASLVKVFKGCHAIFSFLPPAFGVEDYEAYQDKVGEAIAKAVIVANVQHVVNLSSLGAGMPHGTGPIKGLHRQERRLNEIPNVHLFHLRPGYFMENFFWSIPSIKSTGIIGSLIKSDLPIPMVATHDVGLKCAEVLDGLKFTGQTIFEFLGPREVTMNEAAKILGNAIKKPDLKYVQLSPTDSEKALLASGMKPKTVQLMLEMHQAINEKKLAPTHPITEAHRGKTTCEEFSKTFEQKYQQAAKSMVGASR